MSLSSLPTVLLILCLAITDCSWLKDLNLPRQLLEYHVSTNPSHREQCIQDPGCKIDMNITKCFGFEPDCIRNNSLAIRSRFTKCDENLNSKTFDTFFREGDFGYLDSRLVKHEICASEGTPHSSSQLMCSDHLTHCVGRNIYFDFSMLNAKSSTRYRQDVIKSGQVGGNCQRFDRELLENNLQVKGYLMSWADELQHFESNSNFKVDDEFCDVIFERPTVIMKLDAAVNLYHHFCDFLNLYASMHLNQTFDQDIDIVWWDTHPEGFIDKMYGVTWNAFSKHKPFELKDLDQKRVCFKNVMMPLLARQRYGLFYNSHLVQGCSGSTLFRSFSQFILHRLGIKPAKADLEKVRIVILSRSTAFRRILNLKEVRPFMYRMVINK